MMKINKKIVIICVCIILSYNVYAEDVRIFDNENEFNGKTEEILYTPFENDDLKKIINLYNDNDAIEIRKLFLREELTAQNGIMQQIQFYNDYGYIEKYEILFSSEYFNIHGINKMIEFVDDNDTVIRSEWYIDDYKVDFLEEQNIIDRFPYYKISYLNEQMTDVDYVESERDVYAISAKYRGIRSVVLCNGKLEPLNEEDIEKIDYIGRSMKVDNIDQYYSSKMYIEEDGKKYLMYVQTVLEKYLPKNDLTTIRYYFATLNSEFYLIITNLSVIKR